MIDLNKRKYEISVLNVIFCLLVIFIHTISELVSTLDVTSDIYNFVLLPWRLSSFVVQGFVLLSGIKLFLKNDDDFNYLRFLKSRLKSIILPYAIWFCIYYAFFMIATSYPLSIKNILQTFLSGSLVYHLYFVVIIVQFYLLMPLWRLVVAKCSWVYVVPISFFITVILEHINFISPQINFIYYDRIFTTYLVYWIIGCYIGENYSAFKRFCKNNFNVITAVFSFSLLSNASLSLLGYKQLQYIPKLGVVHLIYSVCVVIFLYVLALKIPEKVYSDFPLISLIDKSSYRIYLSHCLVIFVINSLLDEFGIVNLYVRFILRFIFTYLLTIYLNIKAQKKQ